MFPLFLKLFSKGKPPPDDQELVRLYKQTGEMRHLGELFQRHTDMVYLVCRKYLKDEEESKDATMQVFEQLAESLHRHEVTNFKSWLHVLTKNHCLMQLRAQKKVSVLQLDDVAHHLMENGESQHPITAEEAEITAQALEQGIEALASEQRVCPELFYLQQKSYKEITELTGYDLKKVKSYIQNGKRNLKIYMEKHHAPR
ncbi:RNA polymerase sigma-70 factor (ECF subfamily) [Pontibacter ummariensis]|uniref:RNA polymerase sigma-70 factor, ECF subfamily n=1 Tax=Pontibacter ummariensis TaxID=1610492 RepID=A0A239I7Z7_9BACT|nr:sigma-70 family RNA polymerase sigma factor [Pontibacter ummariensis]PRY09993.1 RNA polymerase sigma-70 factor (ECF subfamily) [Pontibacter ummariensis]SNS89755.1 RNA polymerase sigma-70 factor, ECF subfamily [Pontibacter ummariensis]